MSTAVTLDHVGVAARDLGPLTDAYGRLGFALSPIAQQSGRRAPDGPVELFGSGNRCAFLRHGYIELIAILDAGRFANGLDGFLSRYAGLHIIALAMEDEAANLERLRKAGISIPGIAWLERPVEAGGPTARFARLPLPDAPEGRLQLIRHLTPELVWDARWMGHRNGAVALESVILASDTPAETAARLSRLAGLPLEPDPAGGYLLALPGLAGLALPGLAGLELPGFAGLALPGLAGLELPGLAGAAGPQAPLLPTSLRILPTEALPAVLPGVAAPASPCIAGMVVRTGDGNAAVTALLAAEGIPAAAANGLWGQGLMVPPEFAGGAALVFAA